MMGNLQIIVLLATVFADLFGKETNFQEISDNKLVTTEATPQSTSPTYHIDKEISESSWTSLMPDLRSVSEQFVPMDKMQDERRATDDTFFPIHHPTAEINLLMFDLERPLKTIQSFCPFTQICQTDNKTDQFEYGEACCMRCDCSDRCYAAGTCCADMTNASRHYNDTSFISTEESCVNTMVAGSDYEGHTSRLTRLLFQKCGNDVDVRTKQKCLYPDVFQFDEMMPVFNGKSQRHYRNVFCAKCNNDSQNLLPWQSIMSCTSNSTGSSSSEFPNISNNFSISLLISTNPSCALMWQPPLNVKGADRCIRGQDIVSGCNKPILDSLCKQYYAPVKGGNIIYRNVFCMECAIPSNLTGYYKECYPDDIRLSDTSFTAILSLSSENEIVSKSQHSKINMCPSPMRYNYNLGSCIHQTCSISKINIPGGVCRPFFSQLINIHLEYRLKLSFRVFTEDTFYSLPFLQFDKRILDIIGITETLDNHCFSEFTDVKFTPTLTEINAIYLKSADNANIQQSYKAFAKRVEAYNDVAKENRSMFLLEVDNTGIDPVLEDTVTFVKFTESNMAHFCLNNFAMTKLQFCNTVTFPIGEFILHVNGTVSVDNLIFRPGSYVPRKTDSGYITSVQVCLDDYVSTKIINNLNYRLTSDGGYGWKQRSGILFLMCAAISNRLTIRKSIST